MLNDWSHKVRAILKKYCLGNIKKILPSLSQSAWNTRFYFGHQKSCMDNNNVYCSSELVIGYDSACSRYYITWHVRNCLTNNGTSYTLGYARAHHCSGGHKMIYDCLGFAIVWF